MTDPDTTPDKPATDPAVVAYEALLALLATHDGDDRCGHLGDAIKDSLLATSHAEAVTVALGIVAHCELTCEVTPWSKSRSDERQGRTDKTDPTP